MDGPGDAWKKEFPLVQRAKDDSGLTPQYVLETLDRLTGSSAIIATEVGQHQMWAAQFYTFRRPRQFVFRAEAMVGASGVRPEAFRWPARIARTPAWPGYLPVSKDAREGEHTGLLEYQLVNLAPEAASPSMLGVQKSRHPMQDKSPYPWSSVIMKITFGCFNGFSSLYGSIPVAPPMLGPSLLSYCRQNIFARGIFLPA